METFFEKKGLLNNYNSWVWYHHYGFSNTLSIGDKCNNFNVNFDGYMGKFHVNFPVGVIVF